MSENSPQKIIIEIFVPSGKCACSYSKWINKIWDNMADFKKFVEVDTLDTDSLRAKELGLRGQTLLVNGERIPLFQLKTCLKSLVSLFDKDVMILNCKTE